MHNAGKVFVIEYLPTRYIYIYTFPFRLQLHSILKPNNISFKDRKTDSLSSSLNRICSCRFDYNETDNDYKDTKKQTYGHANDHKAKKDIQNYNFKEIQKIKKIHLKTTKRD